MFIPGARNVQCFAKFGLPAPTVKIMYFPVGNQWIVLALENDKTIKATFCDGHFKGIHQCDNRIETSPIRFDPLVVLNKNHILFRFTLLKEWFNLRLFVNVDEKSILLICKGVRGMRDKIRISVA
jgi:hypothetical protein